MLFKPGIFCDQADGFRDKVDAVQFIAAFNEILQKMSHGERSFVQAGNGINSVFQAEIRMNFRKLQKT